MDHPSSWIGEVAAPQIVFHQRLPPGPTQQGIHHEIPPLKSLGLNALLDVACSSALRVDNVIWTVVLPLPGVSPVGHLDLGNETD